MHLVDHFHDSITTNLALKISNQVGIPIENAEKFQIVYYGENNEYRAHYDSWDNDGSEKSLRCVKFGGPRLKTALVYLNTVEEGGSTRFTKLNKEVSAQQGKLLVFDNVYKDTINKHHLSEHAGMPVKKGEKFSEENLGLRRPGDGLAPSLLKNIYGLSVQKIIRTILKNYEK